ncbi:MAG: galactofuranosyltransferase GlfT2 [Geodermatophilaceae bacterium]|nr:galactofuranosyltransferase GlfT2 [Geodermatophilaceae bacterium]
MSTSVQEPSLPPADTPNNAAPPSTDDDKAARRVVARVVFPEDRDLDTLPLYIDFSTFTGVNPMTRIDPDKPKKKDQLSAPVVVTTVHGDFIRGRRSLELPAGERISFGTYFNAFPASYWRRWTDVSSVALSVRASGSPTVIVYRSNPRGATERVAATTLHDGVLDLELSLAPFGDGGWYWFDLLAGREPAVLEYAEWSVPDRREEPGGTTIAITTYNRPDYCAAQLRQLGAAAGIVDLLDEVLVMDQGSDNVADQPDFAACEEGLRGKLRVIRQANLGGSGGFSRGMREALAAGRSRYVLLLDDDIVLEPEGIARAVAFADECRSPTVVGGHMFNMYDRSILHAWAEYVEQWRFFWGPVPGTKHGHNFALSNLRATAWMHKRFDVDYNGWWMCLIPLDVIRKVGLSLPLFIKWDDAEFCLRAGKAGFPTVSLPGAAVWHIPWMDKDDSLDWQAYYHQRNRWLVALLHSSYPRGGSLISLSLRGDLKQLLAMQYSAVELRLQALEDLLDGPERLHAALPTSLARVRTTRAGFSDARVERDHDAFPPPRRVQAKRGRAPELPTNRVASALTAASGALRQFRGVRESSRVHPEASIAAMDGRWWMLSRYDSALVTTADGTAQSWYQRDPEQFRSMLRRSIALHQRAAREWPALAERYKAALPQLTSPEAWDKTFGRPD